jgi:hypothetical protein
MQAVPLPLAYFLSCTCYGQRLHGDERGSVDCFHNTPGTPLLPPDAGRERHARDVMDGDPVTLSPSMREVVDKAIVQLCDERDWRLPARNARATHFHAVLNCRGELSPERALALLKARATRDLRLAGLVPADARLWTEHGSTRWINHERGLFKAIVYVNEWQSGPNRRVLEEHKRLARQRMRELKEWLGRLGLRSDDEPEAT